MGASPPEMLASRSCQPTIAQPCRQRLNVQLGRLRYCRARRCSVFFVGSSTISDTWHKVLGCTLVPHRQATRVWVTVAACLLLLFIAASSILSWKNTKTSPSAPKSGRGGEPTELKTGRVEHSALHAAIGPRSHIHQAEPRYAKHEQGDFSDDGTKQHPDDLAYVDVWVGYHLEAAGGHRRFFGSIPN